MILTYSIESFVDEIKYGSKIHTIRADSKNRWKAGMKIHQWKDNPRNVSKNPFFIREDTCISVQSVEITKFNVLNIRFGTIKIDGRELTKIEHFTIARNDGFENARDFIDFFIPGDTGIWKGKLIHWTDKKY